MGRKRTGGGVNEKAKAEMEAQEAELKKKEAEVKAEKERKAVENTEKLRKRRRGGIGRSTLIVTSARGLEDNSSSSLY
jgi:ribosomal protein L29